MADVRPKLSEIRAQLARVVRGEVRAAAGEGAHLEDPQRELLTPFVRAAAEGRSAVQEVVDETMRRAAAIWAQKNQSAGPGKAWLSDAELSGVGTVDPALETLTRGAAAIAARVKGSRAPLRVELEAPPGVSMGTRGVRTIQVSLSAGPAVAVGARLALLIDGHRLPLTMTAAGLTVQALRAPEGYGLEVLEGAAGDPHRTVRLKITRDAETALPHGLLAARAKAGLTAYLKNDRIDDPEWARNWPSTWPENVARGIVQEIEAFFAHADVQRKQDSVVFVGAGPNQLYTEIEVSKRDGRILRAMVEVD